MSQRGENSLLVFGMNLMTGLNFYLLYIIQDILFRGSDFSLKSKASGKKLIAVDLNALPKPGLLYLFFFFLICVKFLNLRTKRAKPS